MSRESNLPDSRFILPDPRPQADPGRVELPEVPSGDQPRRELPRLPGLVRFGAFEFTYLDGMRYQARSRSRPGEHHIISIDERECSCPSFRNGACCHLLSIAAALTRTTGASVK